MYLGSRIFAVVGEPITWDCQVCDPDGHDMAVVAISETAQDVDAQVMTITANGISKQVVRTVWTPRTTGEHYITYELSDNPQIPNTGKVSMATMFVIVNKMNQAPIWFGCGNR